MPYSFEEPDHEPQTQPQGGGRREPPRTGVLVDMLDAPEPRAPVSSLAKVAAVVALLIFLAALIFLLVQSVFSLKQG